MKKDVMEYVETLARFGKRQHGGKGHGPSRGAIKAMKLLQANGAMSIGAIAEQLELRSGSVSELLTKLEAHGSITRSKDENDSRVTLVALTEQGSAKLEAAASKYEQRKEEINAILTDEESLAFALACEKLLAYFEAQGEDMEDKPGHKGHGRGHGRGRHGGHRHGIQLTGAVSE
ncbi:MAG: MarR family winged helix-turn-helix transcriptional regulator [Erysipelotrichaceae bacterium]